LKLKEVKDRHTDKKYFQYSTQEFNSLIDLVEKGQLLYDDFKPMNQTLYNLKIYGK
jgi:hypothetical protein